MVLSPDKAKKSLAHTGWLSCHLSSHCRLSSTCASASHRTAASHCTPLVPLVRLVVALPLVTPPPPVHLRLCLSSHHRLLPRPSYASCPAGCHVTSCHAAASRQPASPPLIAPLVRLVVASPLVMPLSPPHIALPPLIAPLLRLLSGWLLLLKHHPRNLLLVLRSKPYYKFLCHPARSYVERCSISTCIHSTHVHSTHVHLWPQRRKTP
jgi:hypothetical protein